MRLFKDREQLGLPKADSTVINTGSEGGQFNTSSACSGGRPKGRRQDARG
jgi:hypothetical protein